MKLFVFQYVNQVSNSYHSGGGLAIIAPTREAAQSLADRTDHVGIDETDFAEAHEYEGIVSDEEKIYIFPDAGCC